MKLVFAGTPDVAVPCLAALNKTNHDVLAVFTQPDRPAGRGRRLMPSPVKAFAASHDLPLMQPSRIDSQIAADLKKLAPDIIVVIAYGLMLPKSILSIPRYGCLNLHFSLLPRWRGASPIQHALLYGDEMTGVTVMQMDEGLDTGPILAQQRYAIDPDENSQMLHDRLADAGAQLLLDTLKQIESHQLMPTAQDERQATYANKIHKSQGVIDWRKTADQIVNQVRAYNPWPVAFTYYQGQRLRIWAAERVNLRGELAPGVVMAVNKNGIDVATGSKVVRILELQLPGGRKMSAWAFINAHHVLPGETLLGMGECGDER